MEKLVAHNRRSLDPLSAKCYYYHARVYELMGTLAAVRRYTTLEESWATVTLPLCVTAVSCTLD